MVLHRHPSWCVSRIEFYVLFVRRARLQFNRLQFLTNDELLALGMCAYECLALIGHRFVLVRSRLVALTELKLKSQQRHDTIKLLLSVHDDSGVKVI